MCTIPTSKKKIPPHRVAMAKLRISNHSEKGRWHGVPREEGLCKICGQGELEDGIHFLTEYYSGFKGKVFD